MKKCIIFFLFLLIISVALMPQKIAKASNNNDFLNSTLELLDEIDTTSLEDVFNNNSYYNSIKGNSFKEKIKTLISQEGVTDNFFKSLINIFVVNITKYLSFFIILFVIAVLTGMIETIKPDGRALQMSNTVYLVCYLCCITILLSQFVKVTQETSQEVKNISSKMQLLMPLILSLMTVSGLTSSVAIYRPIVVVFSNSLMTFIMSFLIPLITGITIINLVTQLTDKIKLNKLKDVLSQLFKWIIGLSLTLFSFFLSVKGITASKADGISLSAIKYLSGQVPVIGGFLREGSDIFLASAELIKNAVGKMSVFVLIWELLSPVISLLVLTFGLNIVAALSEPFADSKIVNAYSSVAKSFSNLMAILLMVGFMFSLTIILLICSSAIL